jgi:putative YhbY family RNA-binding protein
MIKVNHHTLQPSLVIGKAGVTESVVKKANELLKRKKVIKVKFLKTSIDGNKYALVEDLAKQTNSNIIHRVGFIVVLERIQAVSPRKN